MKIPVRSFKYVIVPTADKKGWSGSLVFNTAKGEISIEILKAEAGEGRWQPTGDFLLALAEGVLGSVDRLHAG